MKKSYYLPVLFIFTCLLLQGKPLMAAGADMAAPRGEIDQRSWYLGGIAAWAEVVSIGIKKMALSSAMSAAEMDGLVEAATEITEKAKVRIFREPDFLQTDLFPVSATRDKHVLIITTDATLEAYLALKKRKAALLDAGTYNAEARMELAWAVGKLLSYPDTRIETLIAKHGSAGD